VRKALLALAVFLSGCAHGQQALNAVSPLQREEAYRTGFNAGLEAGKIDGYYRRAKVLHSSLCLYQQDALALAAGREAVEEGIVKVVSGRGSDGRLFAEAYFSENGLGELPFLYAPSLKGGAWWCSELPPPPPLKEGCTFSNPVLQLECRRGEREGRAKGEKLGEKLAYSDFVSALSGRADGFLALEKDKFYRGNLTYPRLYQTEEGKKLVPPRVESVRTVRQILSLTSVPLPEEKKEEKGIGFGLPESERSPYLDSLPSDFVRTPVRVRVRGEEGDFVVLSKEGISFEVEDGKVYAVFSSRKEAEDFCTKYPLVCVKR